jgi:hypothetical protein
MRALITLLSIQLFSVTGTTATEIYEFYKAQVQPHQISDVYGAVTSDPNIRLLSLQLLTAEDYGRPGTRRILDQRVIKAESANTLPRIELTIQKSAEMICEETQADPISHNIVAQDSVRLEKLPVYLGVYELYIDGILFGSLEVGSYNDLFTEHNQYASRVEKIIKQESAKLAQPILQMLSIGKLAKGKKCQIKVKGQSEDALNFEVQFDREERSLANGDIVIRPAKIIELSAEVKVQRDFRCEEGNVIHGSENIRLKLRDQTTAHQLNAQLSLNSEAPDKLSMSVWSDGGHRRECTVHL